MNQRMKAVLAGTATVSVVAVLAIALLLTLAAPPDEENIEVATSPNAGGGNYWSMPGSAGAVDERDTDIFKAGPATMTILKTAGSPATLNVRYPVTTNPGMTGGATTAYFQFRFRDNGDDAQVICKLKALNFSTGEVTTLLTLDSNDYTPSDTFQHHNIQQAGAGSFFDFNSRIYFVDVALKRTAAAGKPALSFVLVGKF